MKQGFESGAPENVQSATGGTTPAIRTAAGRDALTGGSNRWRLAVALVCVAAAIPLAAQQTRVYKDGNAWVEETTGTMPSARELRVNTDLGSIEVQGNTTRFSLRDPQAVVCGHQGRSAATVPDDEGIDWQRWRGGVAGRANAAPEHEPVCCRDHDGSAAGPAETAAGHRRRRDGGAFHWGNADRQDRSGSGEAG